MFPVYKPIPCKHCGRVLGHVERSVSIDLGLDSDECPNNVRCMVDAHGSGSPIGQAYLALRELRDRWNRAAQPTYA